MKTYLISFAVALFFLSVFGVQQWVSRAWDQHARDNQQIGQLQQIKAQDKTDIEFATVQMQKRNEYDEKMFKAIPQVLRADDGAVTGPAIGKRMLEHAGPVPARATVDKTGKPLTNRMGGK